MCKHQTKTYILILYSISQYDSSITNDEYKDQFNQLFIYPYAKAIAKSVIVGDCKSDFESGQPHRMQTDDKTCFKTDGLIKLYGLDKLELLLLETSGHFGNKEKSKLNFDHHKGLFRCVAMSKCVADQFEYRNLKKFSKVKVFFLNGAGNNIP